MDALHMAMDGPRRLTRNLFFDPDWMSFKGLHFQASAMRHINQLELLASTLF